MIFQMTKRATIIEKFIHYRKIITLLTFEELTFLVKANLGE